MTATELIKKNNGTINDSYSLINNWGYIVSHNGAKYDVRRWRNCYGADCGWGVCFIKEEGGKEDETFVEALSGDLNDTSRNSEW